MLFPKLSYNCRSSGCDREGHFCGNVLNRGDSQAFKVDRYLIAESFL